MQNSFKYLYITSPLNQFEIQDFFSIKLFLLDNLELSLTNIGIYLTIGGLFLVILNLLSTNNNKLIGNS